MLVAKPGATKLTLMLPRPAWPTLVPPRLCPANPGATKTAMAQSANALATSYAAIGDTSRAIKHHGEALRIRRAQVSSHGGTHEMEAAASSMYRLTMVYPLEYRAPAHGGGSSSEGCP